ncbi:MAG TPA: hypothetical protein VM842_08895 [Nitrospira sp.]|nr:hypothetical protein [Nitrospira sp.]
MNGCWPALVRSGLIAFVMIAGPAALFADGEAESVNCALSPHHAGLSFPLDRVEGAWACRLQPIVSHYTTATKIGPMRTPLPRDIFLYLLDHPVMAAALLNRLDLGLYKAEQRGQETFWATDGQGTDGVVQLLLQDHMSRIYYLEGSHDGRFLPRLSGKAVVLLRLQSLTDSRGIESIDSTMVAYLRLDNRFFSGLFSLLRPLIGNVVNRQLLKAFEGARLLGEATREHPERVLFEATDPPSLPDEEVDFLKAALARMHNAFSSPRPTAK